MIVPNHVDLYSSKLNAWKEKKEGTWETIKLVTPNNSVNLVTIASSVLCAIVVGSSLISVPCRRK